MKRFQKCAFQLLRLLGIILFLLIVSVSCKKDKTQAQLPTVETLSVTEITPATAKVSTKVTADGGATVTGTGACWGTSVNPDLTNGVSNVGGGTGTFTTVLTGLQQNTTYHVRAFATNSVGTAYGNDLNFTTLFN